MILKDNYTCIKKMYNGPEVRFTNKIPEVFVPGTWTPGILDKWCNSGSVVFYLFRKT